MAAIILMLGVCPSVSAQGFLSKAKKAVESATQAANYKINYDAVPVYTIKEVKDGTTNADGTENVAYLLVDQFGNIRTAAAVKEQQKTLNKALLMILAKVGGGAGLGALSGGGTGALVGGAAGALASADDIKKATQLKKTMSAQKKLLATYEKNFTVEGKTTSAKVDVTKVEGIDPEPMKIDKEKLDNLLAAKDDSSTGGFLEEEE